MRTYDTLEGIQEAAKTLGGLNELIRQRREAGYVRKEKLAEFVVFGLWHFDSCGNCGKGDKKIDCPDVVTKDDFWKYAYGKTISCSLGDGNFPPAKVICSVCGIGWTIENCEDVVKCGSTKVYPLSNVDGALYNFLGMTLRDVKQYFSELTDAVYFMQDDILIRNDRWIDNTPNPNYPSCKKNERGWAAAIGKGREWEQKIGDGYVIQDGDEGHFNVVQYYHNVCNFIHIAKTQEDKFKDVFQKAGFKEIFFKPITNQYCPCDVCAPWFEVFTPYGKIIIGWRKRVINIDCADMKSIDVPTLFPNEDVTKGRSYIHAYGWDKAQEYLAKIREVAIVQTLARHDMVQI